MISIERDVLYALVFIRIYAYTRCARAYKPPLLSALSRAERLSAVDGLTGSCRRPVRGRGDDKRVGRGVGVRRIKRRKKMRRTLKRKSGEEKKLDFVRRKEMGTRTKRRRKRIEVRRVASGGE